MTADIEAGMTIFYSPRNLSLVILVVFAPATCLAGAAASQDGKSTDAQGPKPVAERLTAAKPAPAELEVSRYCANVAPSIAEARIAWQTKRLRELDSQVKQRIADLEKAEASAREWVAKREAMLKTANDELVAIYAKMQPENAARQISTMDDRIAVAILGKLKPTAAGAILDEMEAERASRLAGMIVGAEEKKS
jgi:flagellar motility protein MotE (MotC chaperone)